MMLPYLSDRARANEQPMLDKAREIIAAAQHPTADSDLIPSLGDFRSFAWKALGNVLAQKLDAHDETYLDVWEGLEKAGAFSADELALFDREMPRFQGIVARAYPLAKNKMKPAHVRAHAFAHFVNGREEEGMEAGELHVGVRRAFERCYEMVSGLRALANRMGFYKDSDLFQAAYSFDTPIGRSPIQELTPNEPGEAFPVRRNRKQTSRQ